MSWKSSKLSLYSSGINKKKKMKTNREITFNSISAGDRNTNNSNLLSNINNWGDHSSLSEYRTNSYIKEPLPYI